MANFKVPTREEVSEKDQQIFDTLKSNIGFLPNLYASFAASEGALGDYLAFNGRKTSLNNKEKEVVNLIVSEVNNCTYCKAAHTAIGKMNGFTDEQILEIRTGRATFDSKLDALAQYVQDATINRSKPSQETVDAFLAAGYSEENLVDTILLIGDKTVSNFLYGTLQFPVDFPLAPELEEVSA